MRGADLVAADIFGPVAYARHWLWLGIALAALAVLIPVAWWFWTRPRAARAVAGAEAPAADPGTALDRARSQIARVRAEHAAGRLPDRAAHQQLSRVVRTFVAGVSGWPVDRMGVADLTAAMARDPRLAELTRWVDVLQPPAFGPDGAGDVGVAADGADELVGRWAAALRAPAGAGVSGGGA